MVKRLTAEERAELAELEAQDDLAGLDLADALRRDDLKEAFRTEETADLMAFWKARAGAWECGGENAVTGAQLFSYAAQTPDAARIAAATALVAADPTLDPDRGEK